MAARPHMGPAVAGALPSMEPCRRSKPRPSRLGRACRFGLVALAEREGIPIEVHIDGPRGKIAPFEDGLREWILDLA